MPPANPELPEGTDHIVNGAMNSGGSTGDSGGGGVGGSGSGMGGGASGGLAGGVGGGTGGSGGFVGAGPNTSVLGDDTGGMTTGGGDSGGSNAPVKQQLKDGVQSLKGQATDKARSYAADGKQRASSALDEFASVVHEAAESIEERLGAEYGQYARRAADSVSGFASNLREKEVDELFDDARNLVRQSPGVAIGTAAALGFALVRLLKSGLNTGADGNQGGSQRKVDFTPDAASTTQPRPPVVGTATGASATGI